MFWNIVLFVGALALSYALRPKPKVTHARPATASEFEVPTALEAGRCRSCSEPAGSRGRTWCGGETWPATPSNDKSNIKMQNAKCL